ncbi:hypothetical protein DNTS_022827 [Danionella cerebrum]|uniref:Uncharacterized protein n=1 Tax=Danionella cerebrum TaxID=2873325 RepID=A0A553RAR2_9TELE|nr:hypothetical protein DNTS_022827 [Danionella translucida]
MNKLSAKISPSPDPGPVTLHVPPLGSEKDSLEESLVQDEGDEGRPSKPSCTRFPFQAIRRVICGIILGSCVAVSWAWGTHSAKETLTRHPTPFFIIWFCTIWNILFFPVYYLCHLLTDKQKQLPTNEFRKCSGFLGEELTVRVILKGAAPFSVLWALSGYLYLLALCRISKVDVSAVLCCSQAFVFLLSWIGLKDRFMGVREWHWELVLLQPLLCSRKCVGNVLPGPTSVLLSCVGLCGFFLHSWVCLLLYFTHDELWTPSQQMPWNKLCVMASLLLAVDLFVTETLQMSHVRTAAAGIISAGFLLLQLPERWDETSVNWLISLWHGNWREDSLLLEEPGVDTSGLSRAKAKPAFRQEASLCCGAADEESMALNAVDDEDFEWEPPSEAEMKVIQARRERQDKISKLMGDYLLKGFKMLGECCELCGTILLQDKQKKNYCVACQELDSDLDKDNPALNAQAALSQVRERQLATNQVPDSNEASSSEAPASITGQPRPEHCEGAASGLRGPLPTIQAAPLSVPSVVSPFLPPANPALQPAPPVGTLASSLHQQHPALSSAEEAVLHKLRWATQELQHSVSVEASIQLCSLIRGCAESLRSLKELQLS